MLKLSAIPNWKKIGALIVIGLAIGWWWLNQLNKPLPTLTFVNPTRQNIAKTLELSGYIDAKIKARLRFVAGGKIVSLPVKEGDLVKKGQTLAVIDQRDLQKRLQQSLNSYLQERTNWEDTRDDVKDRWLDDQETRSVQRDQLDLNNSVIGVELQDIAISNTVMSSPINGLLISSPAAVNGVQLLATDYFEVIDPQTLIFRAQVDEEDLSLVKLNQPARIEFDAYPAEFFDTYLSFMAYQSSQTTSGTVFNLEFPLPTDGSLEKFRLGLNGDLTLIIEEKTNVLTIPATAINQENDQSTVEVKIADGQTETRSIEVGLESEELVEVTAGLTENDQILLPSLDAQPTD